MKRDIANAHKWNTADTITSVRIAASLLLLFLPLRSTRFIAVYTFTGLTDILDGWLARKTGTASDFGARLDSVADLLFYGIVLFPLYRFYGSCCRWRSGMSWQLLFLCDWRLILRLLSSIINLPRCTPG